MCGDLWVVDECCGDRSKRYEEIGAEVCTETGDETCGGGEGDFLFDVEI
jgi:hypothetical protein